MTGEENPKESSSRKQDGSPVSSRGDVTTLTLARSQKVTVLAVP